MRKLKGFGAPEMTLEEALNHVRRYFRKPLVIAVERALKDWRG